MKLEPWLAPRLDHPSIELMPHAKMVSCHQHGSELEIGFGGGDVRTVDHVIFATGYKPEMARLPYLADAVLQQLETEDGFPVLDVGMQTTVPGLYVTSLPATRYFGLFFGFTSAVRASAQIVAAAIENTRPR
jgi:thioredoxin reductase